MHTRICLATYKERLAVVFDSASHFQIFIDPGNGRLLSRELIEVKEGNLGLKLDILCRSKVDYLLCGALCKKTKRIINSLGIEVLDWLKGDLSKVIAAWQNKNFQDLLLPGYKPGQRCCELPWPKQDDGL